MTYEIQVLTVSNNRVYTIFDIFVEGSSYRDRIVSGLLCIQISIVAMGL